MCVQTNCHVGRTMRVEHDNGLTYTVVIDPPSGSIATNGAASKPAPFFLGMPCRCMGTGVVPDPVLGVVALVRCPDCGGREAWVDRAMTCGDDAEGM